MVFFKKVFPPNSTERFDSWHTVMALSLIVVLTQGLAGFHLHRISLGQPLQLFRFSHALMGVSALFLLLYFKQVWKSHYSNWLFFLLFFPYYLTTWFSQTVYALSGQMFSPFLPIKLYPIVLAFLVPGAYWVNALLMILFYVEAAILWHYLDFSNLTNVIPSNEPITTILFAGVSFTLLFFRYRDEKVFRALTGQQLNAEVYDNLTRIFLSLRDRANTPLQNQRLVLELMKRRYPQEQALIASLEDSVVRLTTINNILGRLEVLPVADEKLMSEEEILGYLEKVEKDASVRLVP